MVSRQGEHWDNIFPDILEDVLSKGETFESRTGEVKEILGYEFSIDKPRTRVLQNKLYGFNPFRALGHWLWIMAGRMDLQFIEFYNPSAENYSSDDVRLHGAYGPRLNATGVYNQIENSIKLISKKKNTRRALAPVFIPSFDQFPMRHEPNHHDEIPCPLALHFHPRDGVLHFTTYMRSQNAQKLLPLDVFTMTLIHEYVSAATSLELGTYWHYTGSMHIFTKKIQEAQQIVDNSTSSSVLMPSIPNDKPDKFLIDMIQLEEQVRGQATHANMVNGDVDWDALLSVVADYPDFWNLVGEMMIFWAMFKHEDDERMKDLHSSFHSSVKTLAENVIEQ